MNPKVTQSAREVLGQFLSGIVADRGISIYQIEKVTGLQGKQIKAVLEGSENYTIDTFLSVIHALDLYIFFSEKEGKHLDFDHMEKQRQKDDPKL